MCLQALRNNMAVLVDDDEDNCDAAKHVSIAAVHLKANAPSPAAEGSAIMDLCSLTPPLTV